MPLRIHRSNLTLSLRRATSRFINILVLLALLLPNIAGVQSAQAAPEPEQTLSQPPLSQGENSYQAPVFEETSPSAIIGVEVVVDDDDPQYSESSGWGDSVIGDSYGGDARITSDTSSNWARWRPEIPEGGMYEVWVWKPDTHSSSTTAAQYTVFYYGDDQTYTVDQKAPSNQWEYLGTHAFVAGNNGSVELRGGGQSGLSVRADAVKFVHVGDLPPGLVSAENSSIITSTAEAQADGMTSVRVVVTALDAFDNPIADANVELFTTGSAMISPINPITNDQGIADFDITNTESETVTVAAEIDGVLIESSAQILFNCNTTGNLTIVSGENCSFSPGSYLYNDL
ncbi:MAG: Ig-like domain-containing protein [Anaerolineales bacterium]|uniref:Ig-like domain-containing protein n=1 Tax=Candidatus Desulfolinea nitratireducens TaxID=2841698 RepID=A0A8J6NJT6_9CHLR|nr:Ig-like domain-containing protein [Candidatus Desulfolinea nitratireducens]MBL6960119.1 Ig-like domain-containing protein [Anaerolineales bacterium]